MEFVLTRGGEVLGRFSTESEALDRLRRELPSLLPQAIALSVFTITKQDSRGRARQRWASRELAARLLGQPLEDLHETFAQDLPDGRFDDALRSGRHFSLDIAPEDGGWTLRLHFERMDPDGNVLGRDKVFLGWSPSRHDLEARSRPYAIRIEGQLNRPAGPAARSRDT